MEVKKNHREPISDVYLLRSALMQSMGPNGNDFYFRVPGGALITNDGFTIASNLISRDSLVGEILLSLLEEHERELGDGTSSLGVLASSLYIECSKLCVEGYNPVLIESKLLSMKGEIDGIISELSLEQADGDTRNLARTILSTKRNLPVQEDLVEALVAIEGSGHETEVCAVESDPEGGSISIVQGFLFRKRVFSDTPLGVLSDTKIICSRGGMEVSEEAGGLEGQKALIEEVLRLKVGVIFLQEGIDRRVEEYLSRRGVLVLKRMSLGIMETLARISGARMKGAMQDLGEDDLGSMKRIDFLKYRGEGIVLAEGSKEGASTVMVSGLGSTRTDEGERVMQDLLRTLRASRRNPGICPGGGSLEVMVSEALLNQEGDMEEMGVRRALSEAYLSVSRGVYYRSANPNRVIWEMKQRCRQAPCFHSLDEGTYLDPLAEGVVESAHVKSMIMRKAIDAVVQLIKTKIGSISSFK